MARLANGRVLDIGFAAQPNNYVHSKYLVGCDIHPTGIPQNYDLVIKGDGLQLPFKAGIFDTVVAGEIVEHFEDPFRFLQECYKVLRVGGQLILSTPNPYYLPEIILNLTMNRRFMYTEEHVMIFPPRWMMRMLERVGFELHRLESGGFIVPFTKICLPSPAVVAHQIIYIAHKSR